MKRRDQGISSAWSFLLGFVLLTLVVPGVLIGPARAVRLIASAVSTTVMQHADPDPVATERSHKLPVVDLLSSEKELVHNGVHHSIELNSAEGEAVIARFRSPENAPFGPYEQVTIAPPANSDLLGGQLATWIAARMGVPVPYRASVYLRRDGDDAGIHEITEFVSASFEKDRNISDGPVQVFRMNADTADAWLDRSNWQPVDSAQEKSIEQMDRLIGVLNDTLINNADRRVALEELLDVEAFNRYHAAMLMLDLDEQAKVKIALVQNPRTGRFYPVLIDAPFMSTDGTDLHTRERDLLGERMMAISDWRAQRDLFVRQGIKELHDSGAFAEKMKELSAEVGPSLTNAGRGRRPLFSMHDPGHSASALQWSSGELQSRAAAYWDRLKPVVSGEIGAVNVNTP